ncbi:MAG: DNA polymerase III subunit beta [Solirubrobacterales bacterium]|nr:DNA polymerase III subunit beta [Solirubrobacterales bacterium]
MKITANRQALLDSLLVVSRAVSTRAALQALSGILVSLDGNGVRMRATDMELGIEVQSTVDAEGEGAVVLPGRLVVEVVRSLPEGSVTLELRENDVEITAGSSSFHLRTLPPDDFPRFPEPEGDPVELAGAPLRETIGRVARAASRDEARPVLTGILVSAENDELTMVATDSYRLAVKRTKLESPLAAKLEANVPARAMRELARLIETTPEEAVRIWLTRNQAIFRVGGVTLNSRLIDGQFPNHRQLLPETYEHEVKLPRVELLEVTRRVAQLAQRNAALRLALAEGELTVSAETPDLGDAREALPAPFTGEPIEIGFNPEFVRDGLESLDTDDILLKLISPLRPGLLEPAEGDDFSYLVMPIRLNV